MDNENEYTLDRLTKFILGELDASESEKIDKELLTDPKLQREINFLQAIKEVAEEENISQRIRPIIEQYNNSSFFEKITDLYHRFKDYIVMLLSLIIIVLFITSLWNGTDIESAIPERDTRDDSSELEIPVPPPSTPTSNVAIVVDTSDINAAIKSFLAISEQQRPLLPADTFWASLSFLMNRLAQQIPPEVENEPATNSSSAIGTNAAGEVQFVRFEDIDVLVEKEVNERLETKLEIYKKRFLEQDSIIKLLDSTCIPSSSFNLGPGYINPYPEANTLFEGRFYRSGVPILELIRINRIDDLIFAYKNDTISLNNFKFTTDQDVISIEGTSFRDELKFLYNLDDPYQIERSVNALQRFMDLAKQYSNDINILLSIEAATGNLRNRKKLTEIEGEMLKQVLSSHFKLPSGMIKIAPKSKRWKPGNDNQYQSRILISIVDK
ncbi:MAG: hypothetical protein MI974_04090 [Chitinophagales bacterium]|nr:hypothetical protein [Chitinophagales bacterium]